MLKLSYDLHIHSCLSPCGDEDMLPSNIVGMAALKGLDIIAITDHNSCKNVPPLLKLAQEYGLIALPGMELCTMEEVHVLCLFYDLSNALSFDEYVSQHLLKIPNDERVFGKQEIVDEEDHVLGNEPYLLINATDISFDEISGLMKAYHGIYIPAHLDKKSNSLLSNLGFIAPDSDFRLAELANLNHLEALSIKNPYLKQCMILTNSDAHMLGDIKEAIHFIECEAKTREAVWKALQYQQTE